jgi:hypothetical protein
MHDGAPTCTKYFFPSAKLKSSTVAAVIPGIPDIAKRLSKEWFSSIKTKTLVSFGAGFSAFTLFPLAYYR